jgi:hypothetical protein
MLPCRIRCYIIYFPMYVSRTTAKDMKNELLSLAASVKAKDGEQADLQCQVLRLLLNSETSTFQFPLGLGPDNQAAANTLWQSLVVENPPNLRTITIQRPNEDEDEQIWDVRPFVQQMLLRLINLESLALGNFECNDSDLCQIADHLPQLR